jgi:3-methyl-2-oxobutanoate hydroxymethyltransferase
MDTQSKASAGREPRKTVTVRDFQRMKKEGDRIAVLTCYDYLFARLLSQTDVDAVLVGDSLGQVVLGYRSTLPVTLDEMIHHTSAVRRGLEGPMLILDMPFLSYQVSDEEALRNAGRVIKETGCEAVKVEGGDAETLSRVRTLVSAGIPVMGHVGLTPQAVHQLGGYRLTGRESEEADRLGREATALQEAGCFSMVLEMVPTELASSITASLEVPTDMLGLNEEFTPKFLRRFAELGEAAREGVASFVDAVKSGEYPNETERYDVGAA